MPIPAMTHPMSMAPGAATDPMFWGSEKIPAPTMDPTIRAMSVRMGTVGLVAPGPAVGAVWVPGDVPVVSLSISSK